MTSIKERPILFNAEMVRAILEGRKTQTRRLIKRQPRKIPAGWYWETSKHWFPFTEHDAKNLMLPGKEQIDCPYGQPGDRLWVRETSRLMSGGPGKIVNIGYLADGGQSGFITTENRKPYLFTRNTPSIHMPRWASRILLEITNVRVERIQEISWIDLETEGNKGVPNDLKNFIERWNKIYPGSWDRNDWVWVVEFKKVAP